MYNSHTWQKKLQDAKSLFIFVSYQIHSNALTHTHLEHKRSNTVFFNHIIYFFIKLQNEYTFFIFYIYVMMPKLTCSIKKSKFRL